MRGNETPNTVACHRPNDVLNTHDESRIATHGSGCAAKERGPLPRPATSIAVPEPVHPEGVQADLRSAASVHLGSHLVRLIVH